MTVLNRANPIEVFFSGMSSRMVIILLHVALLSIGFIYIYPFLWMLGSAFKTPGDFFNQGLSFLPTGEWQISNFVRAWEGANFSRYFLNTVIITAGTTALTLLFSSMAAFALSRLKLGWKKYLLGAITVTFLLPRGFTILPVFEIVRALGLLNTLWAVIIVNTAGGLIFNTFLFYGYMRAIPQELEEAALIDGANPLQRYWRVILPLSGPMVATLALFSFISNWNEFFNSLIFTLGRPQLRTLAVGMYAFVGENSRDWTLMCAAAAISLLPVIIVFVLLQRYFVQGLAGAVKA